MKLTPAPCPFCGHELMESGRLLRHRPGSKCLLKGLFIENDRRGVEGWNWRVPRVLGPIVHLGLSKTDPTKLEPLPITYIATGELVHMTTPKGK